MSRKVSVPAAGAGSTLVEVLVAALVVMVVTGIVFALYRSVLSVMDMQQRLEAGPETARRALDGIYRDLTGVVRPLEESCAFELTPADPDRDISSRLSFCSAMPVEAVHTNRSPGHEVVRIEYRVTSKDFETPTLVRTIQPTAGPGAEDWPKTNALLGSVRVLQVEVFDGKNWLSEWAVREDLALPAAARVRLCIGEGPEPEEYRTRVFIPGGNTVSPKVIRQ